MSIEEEPNTFDNSNKNESMENKIGNKINLKQIKSSILSPPDTPQINNIKNNIENENKLENNIDNIKTIKEKKEELNEQGISTIDNNFNIDNNKEKVNHQNVSNETESINLINSNNKNKNDFVDILKNTNDIEKNDIEKNDIVNDIKNEKEILNNNEINKKEISKNEIDKNEISNNEINNNDEIIINNIVKKENEISKNNEISENKNNEILENKNNIINKEILKNENESIIENSSQKINNKSQISETNKVIVKLDVLDKLKDNDKIHKMSRSDINVCTSITRSLQLHPRSFPFLKPVDPVLLNIPDYFTVIKHPMDLSTIKEKIKLNKYSNINDYISDIELMFNNCFKYNPPTNPVHIAGVALRDYFIEQLRRLSPEVQASLKILSEENDADYLYINNRRPKRQIKSVQHMEPELHIPKKMKVINNNNSDIIKEEKITNKNEKIENKNISNDNKKDIIILGKANSSEKLSSIKPIKIQEERNNKKINDNKTTIKKLIATSRSAKLAELTKNKYNKNVEDEEEDEEDEIEEEQETEDDSEMIDNEEEEDDEEENDITSNLNNKTKSIIKASQKVISKIRSKHADSKIRNISAQTSNINKRSTKSKLLKNISKTPSLSSIPLNQIYQTNLSENLVEMQINTLTMCLQKVTRQLELLQVQSKARKLKKKAKRLAKSLNMEEYDLQSDSDSVEDLISQTSLLTNDANKMLKRKSKTKILNKNSKMTKIRNHQRLINEENNMIEDEKYDEAEDIFEEESSRIINKKKGKNTIKEKSVKKEIKRPKQRNVKQEMKGRKRIPKGSQENSYDIKKVCEYCGDTDTPMWRRGPNGKGTLCNKCGVKWKGGKIYQGEEIPMKKNKNLSNESENNPVIPPPNKERKKNKPKNKKKEVIKNNKSKQQKITEITYNQKKELSEMINYLSEEKISGVVDIIKSSIPDIKDTQEEIELDIETINPATLCKLYNYVKKVSKPKNNKKNTNKNDDTSSGESSGESSDTEDESSDSDSDPNQFLSRR